MTCRRIRSLFDLSCFICDKMNNINNLNKNAISVLLSCLSFLFKSSAFISLIVPFLSKRSENSSFSKSFKFKFTNRSNSFDKSWKCIYI